MISRGEFEVSNHTFGVNDLTWYLDNRARPTGLEGGGTCRARLRFNDQGITV